MDGEIEKELKLSDGGMVIVGWYTRIVKDDGVKEIDGKGIEVVTESKISVVLVGGGRGLICALEVVDEHTLTVLETNNETGTKVSDLLDVIEVSAPRISSFRKPYFYFFFFFFFFSC